MPQTTSGRSHMGFLAFILFGACAPQPGSLTNEQVVNRTICGRAAEYASLTLTCPVGQVISAIPFASYGIPTGECGAFAAGACHAAQSAAIVSAACVGRRSCTVPATNATFGDPCKRLEKALVVQATCTGVEGAVCGSVEEYETLTLTCPPGQTITEVVFASYGMPTGTCESFRTGACHAAGSKAAVERACLGRASCQVTANNATFGDPCRRAYKRLSVQVACTGGGGPPPDLGVRDAGGGGGPIDAAVRDAGGGGPVDAAVRDAGGGGGPVDAAVRDAGGGGNDAGGGGNGGRYFPAGAIWYRDVSQAPLDRESAQVIAWLDGQGWGLGRMQIDFGLEVLHAEPSVPVRAFMKNNGFYTPDCDSDAVPIPPVGALEAEDGYACLGGGDCHLIVTQGDRLYEMWVADIRGGNFSGGCLAVWDMSRIYGPSGRGEGCTSADAAGYPIAPLLFTADEVAAGRIDHAIRFILPNTRIRRGAYLHPATHFTSASSGPASAPPYGTLLRLRPDFPLNTLPNEGARTVARAMQKYGMFLADGGNVALTAQSDRYTRAKWNGLLGSRDLDRIRPGDFQMVDGGVRLPTNIDCTRNPR